MREGETLISSLLCWKPTRKGLSHSQMHTDTNTQTHKHTLLLMTTPWTRREGEDESVGRIHGAFLTKLIPRPPRTLPQLVDEHSRPVSARQYLESALQEVRGFSEKAQSKNRIRTMIRHFFPDRDCFPIVRPVEDEGMLQTLDVQPEHVFRNEFVTQMRALRSLVRSNAQPKTLEGGLVSGSMLCMLAESYVGAVNKGSVPCIKDTWTSVCEAEFQKKVEAVLSQYEAAAKELKKSFPITFEALHEWHAAQETAVLDEFAAKTRTLQGKLGGSLERGIRARLGERYKDLLSENERVCEAEGNKTVQKLYGEVDQKLLLNDYAEWAEYEVDRASVKTMFFQQVALPVFLYPSSHSLYAPPSVIFSIRKCSARLADCLRLLSFLSIPQRRTKLLTHSQSSPPIGSLHNLTLGTYYLSLFAARVCEWHRSPSRTLARRYCTSSWRLPWRALRRG